MASRAPAGEDRRLCAEWLPALLKEKREDSAQSGFPRFSREEGETLRGRARKPLCAESLFLSAGEPPLRRVSLPQCGRGTSAQSLLPSLLPRHIPSLLPTMPASPPCTPCPVRHPVYTVCTAGYGAGHAVPWVCVGSDGWTGMWAQRRVGKTLSCTASSHAERSPARNRGSCGLEYRHRESSELRLEHFLREVSRRGMLHAGS